MRLTLAGNSNSQDKYSCGIIFLEKFAFTIVIHFSLLRLVFNSRCFLLQWRISHFSPVPGFGRKFTLTFLLRVANPPGMTYVRTVQEIVFNEAALKVFTRNCCKVFQEMQNIGLPNLSITMSNKKKKSAKQLCGKMAFLTVF